MTDDGDGASIDRRASEPTTRSIPWRRDLIGPASGRSRGVRTLALVLVIAAAVVGIASIAMVGGIAAADDSSDPPSVPAAYYGDVDVDDADLIVAELDGERRGAVPVTDSGSFGGPDADDDRLEVSDPGSNDRTVTFRAIGASSMVTANETVEWESADVRELSLSGDPVDLTGLQFDAPSELAVNESGDLDLRVVAEDGTDVAVTPEASIESDDDSVTVADDGTITATDDGEATISATFGDFEESHTVTAGDGPSASPPAGGGGVPPGPPADTGPTAAIGLDAATIEAGETITLSATDSSFSTGQLVAYEWTVDGDVSEGETIDVSFDDAGEYAIELVVTADDGSTDATTRTVTVEESDDGSGADGTDGETGDDAEGEGGGEAGDGDGDGPLGSNVVDSVTGAADGGLDVLGLGMSLVAVLAASTVLSIAAIRRLPPNFD